MNLIKNYFNNNTFSITELIKLLENNKIELSKFELYNYISKYSKNNFYCLSETLSQFIAEFINISKPKNLLNLNCGNGEILNYLLCDDITASDINKENYLITNYLFPKLNISNIEIFERYKNEKFDAIYCSPPYGISLKINNVNELIEIHYIKKAMSLIEDGGEIYLLMPNSFLNNIKFESFRKEILKNLQISYIINIPVGFIKGTGIDLALIKLTKIKLTLKTKFLELTNTIETIQKIINDMADFEIELPNEQIKRWDYSFHNPKNSSFEKDLLKYDEVKKIEELAEIIIGKQIPKEDLTESGDYLVLTPGQINNFEIEYYNKQMFINGLNEKYHKFLLELGDVVIPRFRIGKKLKIYLHTNNNLKVIANQNLIIIRGKNAEYIATFLKTENGTNIFNQQLDRVSKGTILNLISISDLKNILIPILPIDISFASKLKLETLSLSELESKEREIEKLKNEITSQKNEIERLKPQFQMFDEIYKDIKSIKNTVEHISMQIQSLQEEFVIIKNLPREDIVKLERLQKCFDENIEKLNISTKKIEDYIIEVRRWFEYYDNLEENSQRYIPQAEYIFDNISMLKNTDYSPFVMQYCRALENEFLQKIFRSYVQYIINQKINLETKFSWDFSRKENGKPNDDKTFEFANNLKKYIIKQSENWFFELGTMKLILSKLNGKKSDSSIKKSPLLQNFKTFLLDNFEEQIINNDFLSQVEHIRINYRNVSAHPDIIDTEKAKEFHKIIKECLINFMENYKTK